MIGNIKKTFPPKTGMQKFYKIHSMSKTSKMHAACSLQNNVEDIKDI